MIRPQQAPEVIERCRGFAGEIQLQRRGVEYEIIYNGVFLMATYNGASEKAAVKEALEIVSDLHNGPLRVLMGGLGVGYSLGEALAFEQVGHVTVVEIEPVVTRWNREYFQGFNGNALSDPRVEVIVSDLKDFLAAETASTSNQANCKYHVVMVDTDNGSTWLSIPSNNYFYHQDGLKKIASCIYPGGAVSFWCSTRESLFESRLESVFNRVLFRTVREKTGREGAYYLASKEYDCQTL